jgi:glycine cleavage system transcriptional repressor
VSASPGAETPARHFALALIGVDRPGIVATVAGGLAELGCNLEDVSTSLLRGHFAMVLVFSSATAAGADEIRRHLLARSPGFDLHLDIWPITEVVPEGRTTHVLRIHGPDQIGIVAAIAEVIAAHGGSIREMSCSREEGTSPTYVVVLELALPAASSTGALQVALDETATKLGLRLTFEPVADEIL